MSERFSSRHWLLVNKKRKITGCHCGFRADKADCGYGDSVVDHFAEVTISECLKVLNDERPLFGDNAYRVDVVMLRIRSLPGEEEQ